MTTDTPRTFTPEQEKVILEIAEKYAGTTWEPSVKFYREAIHAALFDARLNAAPERGEGLTELSDTLRAWIASFPRSEAAATIERLRGEGAIRRLSPPAQGDSKG